ncbi:MAG: NAD(P)/FAD-dependent oxidoreductase [Xanthobacteraceae bacterium]|nr:NAD(P)/FAD-dependent oxidoreductase [Xanthobacteraceae bacterium]MBX9847461.1 NAD(P)/FAD-dependent oxidoreductase [Xanthobacteraceae bacterium]
MAEQLTPDLCVIGAGAAGTSVAKAAAALGVPVVLIEKGRMGGAHLNTADVPSKAMIAAGSRAEAFRASEALGVKAAKPGVEFDQMNDHVHRVIDTLAANDSKERFTGLRVRVIEGEARFLDGRTVAVGPEEDVKFEVRARRFVIATGSKPAVPAISGMDQCPYYTNETIFDARERPKHLIVLGAGSSGLELAQAFRRLGSEVTVLEIAPQPLATEDPECVAVVLDALAREGVTIRSHVKVERVRTLRQRVEVVLAGATEETIQGTELLVATGRQPNIEGLDLAAARVKHDETGITVNKRFGTSNRRIYAIGDVTGLSQSTHAAEHQAALLIKHLMFRLPVTLRADEIPRVTFTEPELAHVGLDEKDAREQFGAVRLLRWPYYDNDRAQAGREIRGHIKVVTDPKGLILGVTIVGPAASEQISAWTLAISHGLNIRVFAELAVPYPTYTEIGKRAAISFFAPNLSTSWLRRFLNVLRRLG